MTFGDGSHYEVTAFAFADEASRSNALMLMDMAAEHVAHHTQIRPGSLFWVKALTDEEAELWKRKT